MKSSSHISRLNPTLKDGLLRVGGCLRHANMLEDAKTLGHAVNVSKLILQDLHELTGHGGRKFILSRLCQRFWIANANAAASKVINNCMVCRCNNKSEEQQQMANLPKITSLQIRPTRINN